MRTRLHRDPTCEACRLGHHDECSEDVSDVACGCEDSSHFEEVWEDSEW